MSNKNIIAIPGSLRTGSSNHAILQHIKGLMPANINYYIYDDLVTIPPFDPDLDNDNPPTSVVLLRNQFSNADGIVICTPEYAFGVPGQLKNMLDWLVSSSSLVDKPVCLITASSSGQYAHPSLLLTLGALSAKLVTGTDLLIPFIRAKMDKAGTLTDLETIDKLAMATRMFLNELIGSPTA